MDILQMLRGHATQAEVFTLEGEATQVTFEANNMKSATTGQTQGVALRGIVEGRLGFTASAGRVDEHRLVEDFLAAVRFAHVVPLEFPSAAPAPPLITYDPALAEVPAARLVEIGREIVDALATVDEDAKIHVRIERGLWDSSLRNSAGSEVHERTSTFSVGIDVDRFRGDEVLLVSDGVNNISFTTAYRETIARLTKLLTLAKRSAALSSGRMPVLFAPGGGLLLMLPILMGTDGQNILRRTSPLSDKLGQPLFDNKLTLWDDPTLPGRPASSRYDGEGVPCRRKALIEHGVCRSFIHDLKTAALLQTRSTGNGRRSLFSPPSPALYNLVLEAGATPLQQIIAGIEHGLFVVRPLGMGQANVISGVFSNTLGLAYAIERGEITGRVMDVSIAGNIYEDLRHVSALSREREWVYGSYHLPYILLPEVNVVCKGA